MRGSSNTTNSLAHMKRKCQYHIVFTPKYRSQINLQSRSNGGLFFCCFSCNCHNYGLRIISEIFSEKIDSA